MKASDSLASKPSVREVLPYILGLNEEVQMKLISLLWKGERPRAPSGIAAATATLSVEFLAIGRVEQNMAPASEVFKINSDGSFSPNSGDGGWGFVIGDHEGQLTKAGASRCGGAPIYLMPSTLKSWAWQKSWWRQIPYFLLRVKRTKCNGMKTNDWID